MFNMCVCCAYYKCTYECLPIGHLFKINLLHYCNMSLSTIKSDKIQNDFTLKSVALTRSISVIINTAHK